MEQNNNEENKNEELKKVLEELNSEENVSSEELLKEEGEKNTNKKIKISLKNILIIAVIIGAIIMVVNIYFSITNSKNNTNTTTNNNYNTSTNNSSSNSKSAADIVLEIEKPIIYLYPEEETKVTVTLGNSNLITCSYPEYISGWSVLAYPNGNLVDLTTNRTLYSLYYESTNAIEFKVEEEGFVVARDDIAEFLEEKLEVLGLSEREAEEFIIYWLPKLQENEYNYIRFASSEEIEANMPLDINPEPDTIIRVLMTYKGLDKPIEVTEQELVTPERTGFVAVEWGGTGIE